MTMTYSVAHSRQHLPSLIAAAQIEPQVITKYHRPVAIVVSPAYFELAQRTVAALPAAGVSVYDRIMAARAEHPPESEANEEDDIDLMDLIGSRSAAPQRDNPFAAAPVSRKSRRKA